MSIESALSIGSPVASLLLILSLIIYEQVKAKGKNGYVKREELDNKTGEIWSRINTHIDNCPKIREACHERIADQLEGIKKELTSQGKDIAAIKARKSRG